MMGWKTAIAAAFATATSIVATVPAHAQFAPPVRTARPPARATVPPSSSRVQQQRQWAIDATRRAYAKVSFLPQETANSTAAAATVATYANSQPDASGYGRDWSPDDCESSITAAEREYNLPPYVLHAIALAESGRGGRPSPVAMNIGGRSYFASGTRDMQRVVEENGVQSSIDVGCLQINLKYHAGRFRDWRSLLVPRYNAQYAALYLTELYRSYGSWTRAIGAYHSKTPWKSANYACLISKKWGEIFGSRRPGCGPDVEAMARVMYANGWKR